MYEFWVLISEYEALYGNEIIAAFFLDISKGVDAIVHDIQMHKTILFVINGNELN